MRDLEYDLEVVTEYLNTYLYHDPHQAEYDTKFFRMARDGWIEALRRAIAAEARVKELEYKLRDKTTEVEELQRELASAECLLHEAEQGAGQVNEEIKGLEAQCAIMREALQEAISLLKGEKKFSQDLTIWGPGGYNVVRIKDVIEQGEKALSNDAGKALLKRMAKLEAVAKTASKFNSTKSEVDWLELQMALAELEGKPQYDDHFCLKDVAYQCKSCGGNVYKTPISSYLREHNIEFCIDCLRSIAKAIIPLCEIRKYGYTTYLIIPSYKHWFYEIQLFKETKWGHESGYYHFTDLHLHDVAMKALDFLIKKKQKEETPRALAELEEDKDE